MYGTRAKSLADLRAKIQRAVRVAQGDGCCDRPPQVGPSDALKPGTVVDAEAKGRLQVHWPPGRSTRNDSRRPSSRFLRAPADRPRSVIEGGRPRASGNVLIEPLSL